VVDAAISEVPVLFAEEIEYVTVVGEAGPVQEIASPAVLAEPI
jgi:hypothetical protein